MTRNDADGCSWIESSYQNLLRSCLLRGCHAILLRGRAAEELRFLCRRVVAHLMCSSPGEDEKSCGICDSCKLLRSGVHPDLHRLDAREEGSIGVDSIRMINSDVRHSSHQGGNRVVWIDGGDLLTEQAANALLKLMEDPPDGTYFLLSCTRPHLVPLTVRSRCFIHSVHLPEESVALRWLGDRKTGHDPTSAVTALRLCGGAPLEAFRLLLSGSWGRRISFCNSFLLSAGKPLELRGWFGRREMTYWLLTVISDLLKLHHGMVDRVINVDRARSLGGLQDLWPAELLHAQYQLWRRLYERWTQLGSPSRELLIVSQLACWEEGEVGLMNPSAKGDEIRCCS